MVENDTSDPVHRDPKGDDTSERDTIRQTPIVGIGASAGGLEALKDFLAAAPNDVGACFVFVQHLDPDHKSMLTDLLTRCTDMPVLHAEGGMRAEPNQLIIIPPDSTLTIENGVFHLERPAPPRARRTPIDAFFHSLAADQGDGATAIVLSGTGSDGTQGIRAVKEAGGFIIVQDPTTAKYDSMPRNADATGLVDQVLPTDQIPNCLIDHLSHLRHTNKTDIQRELRDELIKVCGILKVSTGHDFRDYKEPTLVRRVQRRMQVLRISNIADYVRRLRNDESEVRQLFRELLVSVTGFFRDPEAFEALDECALRPLIDDKEDGDTIRVWVPGCATGEEAYSIAMALKDRLDDEDKRVRVQIFATDLDEAALKVARRGVYPESITNYVPDEFLKRFFRIVGGEYQLSEEIRELCIFSTQSLVKDPPFSKLDLISCRNVLIYLKTELQNRLIPVFHYALQPGGFLLLGPSENVTRHNGLFEAVDKKWRIFRRKEYSEGPRIQFPITDVQNYAFDQARRDQAPARRTAQESIVSVAEKVILEELGPAYAVVSENRELLYSGGKTEPFLKLPHGPPSLEILSVVHDRLRMDVRAIMHRAANDEVEARRENISLETAEGRRRISLLCRPLADPNGHARHYLLVFKDHGPQVEIPAQAGSDDDSSQVQALENELRATKDYLQTTTEELESSNEELKSANEELMSMNEELQSSNEELETSKEELQSVNEELETVNSELASKVEELGRANADLENLLESTQIATLFLDRGLRVRRFTPVAKDLFHLIDGDVGRSITDIAARLDNVDLGSEVEGVLKTLTPVEREVRLRDGNNTFMMRLLPYRTPDDVIDGVVATFVDVTRLETAQTQIDELNGELTAKIDELETLLDLAPVGIAFSDEPSCEWIDVNRYGAQIMKIPRRTRPAGGAGVDYRFISNGVEIPPEELPLQRVWRTGKPVNDFRATFVPSDGQAFEYLMSAAPILDPDGNVRRVIGVYDDVSRLVEAQKTAEIRASQQDYVATLGALSLRGQTGETLMESVPAQIARILNVGFTKVLQYRPGQTDFELRGAFGFDVPAGTSIVGGLNSQAGYTMHSGSPVIVENLAMEKRFDGPPLLKDARIVSGVSVLIGDPEKPWGVLGAHTDSYRAFTADDVKFLQSVANVIAATLQRDEWGKHQQLLLDELRHRVKNSLANVQAIAALSFRQDSTGPDTVKGFISRLHALAQAHNLHFQSDWKDVEIKDLLRQQLEPFDEGGSRILLQGVADVKLEPNTAIDLAMVIHELVTNAAKYGALSNDDGSIEISWSAETRADQTCLVLDWFEKGGPKVDPPSKQGIGSKLMEAFSRRPSFSIERDFRPDGMVCRIEAVASPDKSASGRSSLS